MLRQVIRPKNRGYIRPRANNPKTNFECNSQIFQVYPPRNDVTLADIEDIINITENMSDINKKDTYLVYGIDYKKVKKY